MKRRFAALVLTTVVALGSAAPAFAATRDTGSRDRSVRELVMKVIKKIFYISAQEDLTPPKPCVTNCP